MQSGGKQFWNDYKKLLKGIYVAEPLSQIWGASEKQMVFFRITLLLALTLLTIVLWTLTEFGMDTLRVFAFSTHNQ